MSDGEVFPVPAAWAKRTRMTAEAYEGALAQVETDPDAYWRDVAKTLTWSKPFTVVKDTSFDVNDFHIRSLSQIVV